MIHFLSTGCKPEQQMMYAGSKNCTVQATEISKVTVRYPMAECNHKNKQNIAFLINNVERAANVHVHLCLSTFKCEFTFARSSRPGMQRT